MFTCVLFLNHCVLNSSNSVSQKLISKSEDWTSLYENKGCQCRSARLTHKPDTKFRKTATKATKKTKSLMVASTDAPRPVKIWTKSQRDAEMIGNDFPGLAQPSVLLSNCFRNNQGKEQWKKADSPLLFREYLEWKWSWRKVVTFFLYSFADVSES